MRYFRVIVLLIGFTAAHYGRQVSYLECRLVNYLQKNTASCDCEKILLTETPNGSPEFPSTHNHVHIDESYFSPGQSTGGVNLNMTGQTLYATSQVPLHSQFLPTPEQPPWV